MSDFFCFIIDKQKFGINVIDVDRVIMAQSITPVKGMPNYVSGVIDFHGVVISVLDFRNLLNFPIKELDINDCFVLGSSAGMMFAIIVDSVDGIKKIDQVKDSLSQILENGDNYVKFYKDNDDEIVIIYDLVCLINSSDRLNIKDAIDRFKSIQNYN